MAMWVYYIVGVLPYLLQDVLYVKIVEMHSWFGKKTSLVRYDRQGFMYTTVYRVYMQYIICEDCSQWCAYI